MIWTYYLILFLFVYFSSKKPLTAICLLIPVTLAMIFFSLFDGVNEITKIHVCIITALTFLLSSVAVLMSKHQTDTAGYARMTARWMLIFIAAILLQTSAFILFGAWGIFGIIFIFIAISTYIGLNVSTKFSKPICVLSTISTSIKQSMPLTVVLDAASQNSPKKISLIFKRINKWLLQGHPLSQAIKLGYNRCPGHIPAMIAAAEKINQLPLAIDMLLEDTIKKAEQRTSTKYFSPTYMFTVLFIALLINLFLLKYVMPQFNTTLRELCDVSDLPVISKVVLNISQVIAHNLWWQILLAVFILTPIFIYVKLRPRKADKPLLFSIMGDIIKWHTPFVRWFEKNYSLLRTVEYIKLSLKVEMPFDKAVEAACELDLNFCFKKRLKHWLEMIQSGQDLSDSAKKAKLGNSLSWALSGSDIPASLQMIEESLRSNYSYRADLARMIMLPTTTILLGLIVASVVLAIFLPMVNIVTSLADQVTPM